MTSDLDKYSKMKSLIHNWDARYKFISLIILVFSFSLVMNLYFVFPILIISIILYLISRLPLLFLLKRLAFPSIFILIVVVILPFFSGKTFLLKFGIINIRLEGLILSLIILIKFLSIFIVIIIIFGTESFNQIVDTLRVMKVPLILTDIILFTYRYIFTFEDILKKMKDALRMRGFFMGKKGYKNYFEKLKNMSSLIGSIFVRSYEKSERISHAMILRGYGNKNNTKLEYNFSAKPKDIVIFAVVLFISLIIIFSEIFLTNFVSNRIGFFIGNN